MTLASCKMEHTPAENSLSQLSDYVHWKPKQNRIPSLTLGVDSAPKTVKPRSTIAPPSPPVESHGQSNGGVAWDLAATARPFVEGWGGVGGGANSPPPPFPSDPDFMVRKNEMYKGKC